MNLGHLIDAWRGPLAGLLAARGANWADAEELAQDVFAEAWLGRDRFRGDLSDERAVGAWLAGIARHLHSARSRQRKTVQLPAGNADELVQPVPEGLDLDEARRVRDAIANLPDREREVVQAFYLEGTSTARVAALLETSERAVEGLLRRARARLGEALARPARGSEASSSLGQAVIGGPD